MPVPFRDRDDLESLGTAAFLKIEATTAPAGFRAALFQIDARGEPVEFTYNRVETPSTFLWRAADVKRAAARQLTVSLLKMCPRPPRLIFCLADEMPAEVFAEDLAVDLPVCRIATGSIASNSAGETAERVVLTDSGEILALFWRPAPPEEGSAERGMIERLIGHGLLLEPFDRATIGLAELYGQADPGRT